MSPKRGDPQGIPCPQCGTRLCCPCENCRASRNDETLWMYAPDAAEWIWVGGESMKCSKCGHLGSSDYWLDVEMAAFKVAQERGEI